MSVPSEDFEFEADYGNIIKFPNKVKLMKPYPKPTVRFDEAESSMLYSLVAFNTRYRFRIVLVSIDNYKSNITITIMILAVIGKCDNFKF